jgi:hypothetical protein
VKAYLIGVVALALTLVITGCGHESPPKGTRYILNNGTTGWVRITYNRSDAAPLPVKEGFVVARIAQDLKLSTRMQMSPSWDDSEFYYQGSDGKLVRLSTKDDSQRTIWGLDKNADSAGDHETFFVGNQEQFAHLSRMSRMTGSLGTSLSQASPSRPRNNDEPDIPIDRMKIDTELPK